MNAGGGKFAGGESTAIWRLGEMGDDLLGVRSPPTVGEVKREGAAERGGLDARELGARVEGPEGKRVPGREACVELA